MESARIRDPRSRCYPQLAGASHVLAIFTSKLRNLALSHQLIFCHGFPETSLTSGRMRKRWSANLLRSASASAPKFSVAELFQILFLHAEACRASARSCAQDWRQNLPSVCAASAVCAQFRNCTGLSDRKQLAQVATLPIMPQKRVRCEAKVGCRRRQSLIQKPLVPRQFGVLISLMSFYKTTLVTPQILTIQGDGAGNQRYLYTVIRVCGPLTVNALICFSA